MQTLTTSIKPPIQSVSTGEVRNIIKHLARNVAPGPDGISNTALGHFSNNTLLALIKIFNCYLKQQHFPGPWKTATVVMIPKPGKDLKNPSNHRPIALINSKAKILEISLRTITGSPWFVRNTVISNSTQIPPIQSDIILNSKNMFFKLKHSRYIHLQKIGQTIGPSETNRRRPGNLIRST